GHRSACRAISRAPIAEPAGPEAHVLVFGDCELAARFADVIPIGLDVLGQRECIAYAPTVFFEQPPVAAITPCKCQLEARRGARWEVDELQKLLKIGRAHVCTPVKVASQHTSYG